MLHHEAAVAKPPQHRRQGRRVLDFLQQVRTVVHWFGHWVSLSDLRRVLSGPKCPPSRRSKEVAPRRSTPDRGRPTCVGYRKAAGHIHGPPGASGWIAGRRPAFRAKGTPRAHVAAKRRRPRLEAEWPGCNAADAYRVTREAARRRPMPPEPVRPPPRSGPASPSPAATIAAERPPGKVPWTRSRHRWFRHPGSSRCDRRMRAGRVPPWWATVQIG